MQNIALQHCLNHAEREAVALCPECHQFYCRECITEHDDRVICATCLRAISQAKEPSRRRRAWSQRAAACVLAWMAAALFFYTLGRILISLPSSFHDGTIWQAKDSEEQ